MTIQILLLCAGINCIDDEFQVKTSMKGGFFEDDQTYIMDENRTLEISLNWIGNWEQNYTFRLREEEPSRPIITGTKVPNGKGTYNCTTTMRIVVHRMLSPIKWVNTQVSGSWQVFKHFISIVVQYAQAPKIVFVNSDRRSPNEEGRYVYLENEELYLRCIGEGLVDSTLTWVDSNGDPLKNSQLIEIGHTMKNVSVKRLVVRPTSRDLLVSVQKNLTSFGCRVVSKSFHSGYDVTTWFNMTVVLKPNVTITASTNRSGRWKVLDGKSPNDDSPYRFLENEELFLKCFGEGLVNSTLTWVDSNGDPVESSEVIEIGPQLKSMKYADFRSYPTSRDLSVTLQREIKTFGCRIVTISNQSNYDVTTWFDMAVAWKPNVTLIVDKSTCDQVTFQCLNDIDTSDEVKFDLSFTAILELCFLRI